LLRRLRYRHENHEKHAAGPNGPGWQIHYLNDAGDHANTTAERYLSALQVPPEQEAVIGDNAPVVGLELDSANTSHTITLWQVRLTLTTAP